MSELKTKLWKSHVAHYKEAIHYMKGRQQGKITSIKTPWENFNRATLNGLEFNTMTLIGGRPASGKTLLVDQIVRESFDLNPQLPGLRVLSFQLEMLGRTSKIREFSAITKKTYRELCSGDPDNPIDNHTIADCEKYVVNAAKYPIDIVEDATNVEGFKKTVEDYMKEFSVKTPGKLPGTSKTQYKKTIVTLDHSVLIKKGDSESNKQETLAALGEACTYLKKKYPIALVVLTQLNRDTDKPERNENGKYGNFILESDIYGGDGLLQHADTVAGLNRPAKRFINYYGVERFIIKDDNVLALHWIKARNGKTGISFFEAQFESMSIAETDPPGQDIAEVPVAGGIKTNKKK